MNNKLKPIQQPTLKAITVIKDSDLQYRLYELQIQGDRVIGKKQLDRGAGDLAQIQIARAETILWSYCEQTKEFIEKLKDIRPGGLNYESD